MSNELKRSDVVVLASGGREMTVSNSDSLQHADCVWFIDGEARHGRFPSDGLRLLRRAEPTPLEQAAAEYRAAKEALVAARKAHREADKQEAELGRASDRAEQAEYDAGVKVQRIAGGEAVVASEPVAKTNSTSPA